MRLVLNNWLSFLLFSLLALGSIVTISAQSLDPTPVEDDFFTEGFSDPVSEGVPEVSQIATDADIVKTFTITNTSQKNQDAQTSGANEGDVLRYEFKITSDTKDVKNFLTQLDISNVLKNAEIIDKGLAQQQGNMLIFPSYSQAAPCEKVFTFFVRVKKCSEDTAITANGHGVNTNVPLSCQLNETGPVSNIPLMIAFGIVVGILFFFGRARRKNT